MRLISLDGMYILRELPSAGSSIYILRAANHELLYVQNC
jgi:hypothetical protein